MPQANQSQNSGKDILSGAAAGMRPFTKPPGATLSSTELISNFREDLGRFIPREQILTVEDFGPSGGGSGVLDDVVTFIDKYAAAPNALEALTNKIRNLERLGLSLLAHKKAEPGLDSSQSIYYFAMRAFLAGGTPELADQPAGTIKVLFGNKLEQCRFVLLPPDQMQTINELVQNPDLRKRRLGQIDPEMQARRLFFSIAARAIDLGASDIHMEMITATRGRVRFRIDGELQEHMSDVDSGQIEKLANVALVLCSELRGTQEPFKPQDGSIKFSVPLIVEAERYFGRTISDESKIEDLQSVFKDNSLRVAINTTNLGHHAVLRVLQAADPAQYQLPKLGFSREQEEQIQRLIHRPSGIFLVTGPTGSGKTTTLYAALSALNTPNTKIMTVEDPVEVDFPGLIQLPVKREAGVGFVEMLRSILRCDPDVILIGEIRDAETAQTALDAALTGHMVFCTLHTKDSPSAPLRLFQGFDANPTAVQNALIGVQSQRLVRRLCADCIDFYDARPELNKLLGEELFKCDADSSLHGAEALIGNEDAIVMARPNPLISKTCHSCNGFGYRGQRIVSELWEPGSEELAMMGRRELEGSRYLAIALERGFVPMGMYGLELALRGETSLDELNSRVFNDGSLLDHRLRYRDFISKHRRILTEHSGVIGLKEFH